MTGCMDGVKIVSVEHVVVLPSASAILADWGADVIKIEAPVVGDQTRGIRRLEGGDFIDASGTNYIFEMMNRNKRSVTLNLKTEQGIKILYELVKNADVFMSNFLPDALEKFRLDYQDLSLLNPRLVYATVSGYGELGPSKDNPGYDIAAFWANSGIMDKLGDPNAAPRRQRPAMGDNVTSMCIVAGVSAALFARERTGKGQKLSFSLYNTAVWTLNHDIQCAISTGTELPYGNRNRAANPLWNTYQTKDGRWIELCMLQSDLFWSRFCYVLGLGHLEHDPKFASLQEREKNCEALVSILSKVFLTRPLVEWEGVLNKNNLFSCRVRTVSEVVDDPQAIANDFFVDLDRPSGRRIKLVASPVLFDGVRPPIRLPAPELGQHTEEVLLDLGYTWDDIISFKDSGVI